MTRLVLSRAWVALLISFCFALPAEGAAHRSISQLKRADRIKPGRTVAHPGTVEGSFVVKFRDDLGIVARGGRLYSEAGAPVAAIDRLMSSGRVTSVEPEFKLDKSALKSWRDNGRARTNATLADLSQYFRVRLASGVSTSEAARLCDELNKSTDVELAFLEGKAEVAADINPATPNFESKQDYLKPAPGGVDAYAAWGYPGGNGAGITICDVENGWLTTHEDLSKLVGNIIGGSGNKDYHGTAVMGVMVGDSALSGLTGVGYGVTGISHGASARMVSVIPRTVAEALMLAAQNLTVGDVILIELHQAGPNSPNPLNGQQGFVPMEWTPSVFDAIQTITANGLIVCEAAGNGSENLNHSSYGGWFDTTVQHSGAILIGAGAPPSGLFGPDRSRLSFSNYGWRVDLQGYGQGVVTTGYGGINIPPGDTIPWSPGDSNQTYTASFNGTSSASPIVTGSVACIQGRYKNVTGGHTMTAKEIRDLLYTTGSLQTGTTSQNIGRRPNLAAAMALVVGHSAYASPRTISVSLMDTPQLSDTVWLVNPHAGPTDFDITVKDSLPVLPVRSNPTPFDKAVLKMGAWNASLAASEWLTVSPLSGTVPPNDSVPIQLSFDGYLLFGSYFGTNFKAQLDIEVDGDIGLDTLPVPVMALAQDTIHGDTIIATTPTVTHQISSETNMTGWDYTDASAASWLFDGSLVAGRASAGTKYAYRHVFGNGQRWRGREEWQVDSSWWPNYLIWRDSTWSDDSIIGLKYEVWVPESGDSTDFVLWRTTLYTRSIYVPNIRFGVVGDWDLPDSIGSNNVGGFDTSLQMIYQTGGPGFDQNAAGFALIRGKAYGAFSGRNVIDVYPNNGFTDAGLYDRMATAGFNIDNPSFKVDRYSLLTAFSNLLLEPGEMIESEIAVLSSQSGVAGLALARARARELSDSLHYLGCPIQKTGDFNMDNALNSSDIILTVNYVFKAGPDPQPIELASDVNCSGQVTSADIIYLVNYVFKGGPAPCDACTLY